MTEPHTQPPYDPRNPPQAPLFPLDQDKWDAAGEKIDAVIVQAAKHPKGFEHGLMKGALAEFAQLEAENARLRAALEEQIWYWYQTPGGVDEEADPLNLSPQDATAHLAGLAIRAARAALETKNG